MATDNLQVILKDSAGNNQDVSLTLSGQAGSGKGALDFTFLDKTSDNWNFGDTETAVEKLENFGVDFPVFSLEKTTLRFVLPADLEKCADLFAAPAYEAIFDGADATDPADAIFVPAGSGFENEW